MSAEEKILPNACRCAFELKNIETLERAKCTVRLGNGKAFINQTVY